MKRESKMALKSEKGLTIVETMVTLALFAILMALSATIYLQSSRVHRQGIEMARLRQKAMAVLDIIVTDLSKASRYETTPDNHSINIHITNLKRSTAAPSHGGDTRVEYRLESDHTVTRTDDWETKVIADNVKDLTFYATTSFTPYRNDAVRIEVATDLNDPRTKTFALTAASGTRALDNSTIRFGP
ncbi:MAG: prepilin-type N-terminal cleavage/methylation domain-containing protein [Candidatus Eremiobacteraeota bacterium]|nr:prepilin-type N-terminal cleavage/methylation domain-containing protein [Candidatus Eremiobacteraeota bacterium]